MALIKTLTYNINLMILINNEMVIKMLNLLMRSELQNCKQECSIPLRKERTVEVGNPYAVTIDTLNLHLFIETELNLMSTFKAAFAPVYHLIVLDQNAYWGFMSLKSKL